MLPANCTGWAVPAASPKEQPKPSFLFPLTFPVKLLLLRSETQWPWQGGKWKMDLVGRYYSKTLFRAQISSPGDYRMSNAKISVSRCHQACTGRNFTRCNGSAAVGTPSIRKCSNSMSLLLSCCLLPHSAESLFHSFCCCHAFYCFPLHEHLSQSHSHPLAPRANRHLSPDGLWWHSIDHAEGNGYWVSGNQPFTSPWSQSASVLPSIRQKPPRKYFLHTHISSHVRLLCWC